MTGGAEDVMPLPPDVRGSSWDLAAHLANTKAMIEATQVYDCPQDRVPEWVGESKDAYTESIQKLSGHTKQFAEVLNSPVTALRAWSEAVGVAITRTVPDLRDRYNNAIRAYDNAVTDLEEKIDAAAENSDLLTAGDLFLEKNRLTKNLEDDLEGIVAEYRTAMENLDQVALQTANSMLTAINDPVEPSKQGSREQVGAALFNDIPVLDGHNEWENAQKIAPEIASMIRNPDLTNEDVKAFHDKYAGMLSNPFIANALMDEVTADDVYRFALRISPGPEGSDGKQAEARNAILRQLGAAVALSTGGTNLDSATAADQESFLAARAGLLGKQGRTVDQMVADQLNDFETAGSSSYSFKERGNERHPSTLDSIDGNSIFSQLVGAAGQVNPNLTLGERFYTDPDGSSLAQKLVAWDHATQQGELAWQTGQLPPKARQLLVGVDASILDPMHSMYMLSDTPDVLHGVEEGAPVDVEKARLIALRKFLTSDTPFETDGAQMDMTRYLTGHRTGNEFPFLGFQDAGEAFGDMVADASLPDLGADFHAPQAGDYPGGETDPDYVKAKEAFDARKLDDERRAGIAGNFMLGYQDGLDKNHDNSYPEIRDDVNGQDIYGHTNSRLRSWAGTIIAPHMEGVSNSLTLVGSGASNDESGSVQNVTGHAEIKFGIRDANRFVARGGIFQDLAFDNPKVVDTRNPDNKFDDVYEGGRRPALDVLRMAAREGYVNGLSAADNIRDDTDRNDQLILTAKKWAPLTNALYVADADANQAVKQAMDDRNKAWQDGIGTVVKAIPYAELIGDGKKLLKYAIGQGENQGLPPFLEQAFPTDNVQKIPYGEGQGAQNAAAREEMNAGMYNVLANSRNLKTKDGGEQITFPTEDSDLKAASFVDENGNLKPYETLSVNKDSDKETSERGDFENWIINNTNARDLATAPSDAMTMAESNRMHANEYLRKHPK